MEEQIPRADPLVRAVRTLTIAVVCLTAVLLGQLSMWVYSIWKSAGFIREASASHSSAGRAGNPPASAGASSDGQGFDRMTPEQKIQHATGILLTKHQFDNGKVKSVVVEILRQSPEEDQRYAVGDEIPDLSRYGGDATTRGEGDVVLFLGSRNHLRESYTYRDGRIGGLSDMPLAMLRDLAGGKKSSASPRADTPSNEAMAWVPPGAGGDVVLQTSTNSEGVTREFSIPKSTALRIPEWTPEKGEPPLAMSKAIRSAAAAAQADTAGHAPQVVRSVQLNLAGCEEPIGNRWFYVLDLVPSGSGPMAAGRSVVVLMDGTVVLGRIAG